MCATFTKFYKLYFLLAVLPFFLTSHRSLSAQPSTVFYLPDSLKHSDILSTYTDRRGNHWIATTHGVVRIIRDQVTRFTTEDGLCHDSTTSISEDHLGRIWIGTINGISVYDGRLFTDISYKNGLINKHIHALFHSHDGTLWIATHKGLQFYKDLNLQTFTPLKNTTVFDIEENEHSYFFITEKGFYTFDKDISFWKNRWLWLLSIGMIIGVFIAGGFYYVQRFKLNTELQAQLAHIQQQALLAQMNPHFIFNSLNSIQKYIVKNDKEVAQEYLSKFSRLMRFVLENSRRSSITILEEVKSLELYLQLESLRFEQAFEFVIDIENDQLMEYEIPTMLIQPFVENAVWHGLMNKSSKGKIQVYIAKNGDHIICTVEDNGIGRKKALELKSKFDARRKSRGSQIIQERIELLNRNQRNKIRFEIVDLEPANDQSPVTRVIISIPIKY